MYHTAEGMLSSSGRIFDAPQSRTYRNIYAAIFSAVYHTANLIAFSYLLLVSPPTDQHRDPLQFHAQSILLADTFIESSASPASIRGSLVMIFPLEIVGILGPLQEQRDYAMRKLQNWDREGKSSNMCRAMAPVFLENSTIAARSVMSLANVLAQAHLKQ